MTDQEKAKQYDELLELLKQIFPGNGNVNFDGKVIDKIAHMIRFNDDWKYKQ
jgi:hypothetical protein